MQAVPSFFKFGLVAGLLLNDVLHWVQVIHGYTYVRPSHAPMVETLCAFYDEKVECF